MKRTLAEKLRCVHLHLDEGMAIKEIEQTYGLDRSALKYYSSLYRKWGDKAFRVNVKRRKYSRQMKLEAIHDVIANKKSYYQK